jgi:hypothetical protein
MKAEGTVGAPTCFYKLVRSKENDLHRSGVVRNFLISQLAKQVKLRENKIRILEIIW